MLLAASLFFDKYCFMKCGGIFEISEIRSENRKNVVNVYINVYMLLE